jgi:hypothetical protein
MVCGTTSTAFVTFAREYSHSSDRLSRLGSGFRAVPCGTSRLPALRREHLILVFKDRPSIDVNAARPLPVVPPAGGFPTIGSKLPRFEHVPPLPFLPASTVCAASAPCGSVAPRSRSWGSSRFQLRAVQACKQDGQLGAVPGNAKPFGAFPSTAAAPRHRGRCPLAVPHTSVLASGTLPYRNR